CLSDCGHGSCSGPPNFTCVCHLGWTNPAPQNSSSGGAQEPPQCSVDCGCNFQSSCEKGGPGLCDQCQNWTEGPQCQRCRPGSFGPGGLGGCRPCGCHGHGDPERGFCHRSTGLCHCLPPTTGPHCDRCAPGYYGDPRGPHCDRCAPGCYGDPRGPHCDRCAPGCYGDP
ncbi:multiple epidermal growth factor-like domains protein 8, partial [Onychostruthus taczanowskii]|uniref:multiple epidermal growth factor-like domains protein 8 n=1 Tax=Onychostruthus taczanowskii TaxID=356909 RepID=UPI001B8005E1